ncbi:MAG: hypothetical protein AAFV95_16555 [Bacteroidota bacterium]
MKHFLALLGFCLLSLSLPAQSVDIIQSRILDLEGLQLNQTIATEKGVALVFRKISKSRKSKETVWVLKFLNANFVEKSTLEVSFPMEKKKGFGLQLSKVRNGVLHTLLYQNNGTQGKWVEISLADYSKSERTVDLPTQYGIQDMLLQGTGVYFLLKRTPLEPNSDLSTFRTLGLKSGDKTELAHWDYDEGAMKMISLEASSIRYRLRVVEDERSGAVYCLYVFWSNNQYSFVVKKMEGGEVTAEDRLDFEDNRFVNFDAISTADGRLLVCGTFDTRDATSSGFVKLPVGLFYGWVEQGKIGELVFKKFHGLENGEDFYRGNFKIEDLQDKDASRRSSCVTTYRKPFSVNGKYFFPMDIGRTEITGGSSLPTTILLENSYVVQIGAGAEAVKDTKTLSRPDLNNAKNILSNFRMNIRASTCQQNVNNEVYLLSMVGKYLYARRLSPDGGEPQQFEKVFVPGDKDCTFTNPKSLLLQPWLDNSYLLAGMVSYKSAKAKRKRGFGYRLVKVGL